MNSDFDHLLLEQISDAIIAKSGDGRVLYWSHGAEQVFGYDQHEAIGRPISELIIPSDRLDEEVKILQDVLRTELSQYETTRRRKNGDLIYVDVSSKAVRDDQGALRFILSTNKDVTKLKIERDAKLAASRYGDLIELMPDGILFVNEGARIVLANEEAEKLFGYEKGEMQGRTIEELMPERFRARHTGHRVNYMHHPRTISMGPGIDLYGLRKDGTEFPAEIKLSPLNTGHGAVVLSAIRDISERKAVERRIRDQARIMDLVNDSVITRDMEDRITSWNQGAERTYGWKRGEAIGRISHEIWSTAFPQKLDEIRQQLLTEDHWEGELVHTCRDGATLTVASRWTLQRDDEGEPMGIVELNYDISEKKKFERELEEKNQALVSAAESKNRFLANMSHELRTPLNGIIGFAEFLSDGRPGPLNPKQKEYLTDILNSGRHLLQLINDVLDLAKIEANRMDLFPEKFNLAAAIEGVCAVSRPIAQKKSLRLDIQVSDDLHDVVLDPQKFKQVLYNLLSNAFKFTNEGGQVSISAQPASEGLFSLIVKDTGIGIHPEELPRLFREFEQLESGASRRYEGTGLGLALTRKIVELQGGTIAVESRPGLGSVFTVTLPIG